MKYILIALFLTSCASYQPPGEGLDQYLEQMDKCPDCNGNGPVHRGSVR